MPLALQLRIFLDKNVKKIDKEKLESEILRLNTALDLVNRDYFLKAVYTTADKQMENLNTQGKNIEKAPEWFWIIAEYAAKALNAHNNMQLNKAEQNIIMMAATCVNWRKSLYSKNFTQPSEKKLYTQNDLFN